MPGIEVDRNAMIAAYDEYTPSSLIGLLDGGKQLAIFSLSCAERLGAVVELVADAASIRSTVRSGLELGWDGVEGRLNDGEIKRLVSDLDDIISQTDGNLGTHHGYLDDAISATAYGLEVVLRGDEKAAENVLIRCREVAFQLARQLWPRMTLREQTVSHVMQDEVARQVRDAERVAQWGDPVPLSRTRDLRKLAQTEGTTLAFMIRGEHEGRQLSPSAEQPTLF